MINQNHMEMCRFNGRGDDGYQKFLGALRGVLAFLVQERHETRRQGSSTHDLAVSYFDTP